MRAVTRAGEGAKPGRPRVAVSACLAGEPVRYDGTDRAHPAVRGVLARLFELVPVCPEAGAGLGVPRPPVELVGPPHAPRALGVADRALDVTEALRAWSEATAARLEVAGHVLKARSPSCGLARVPIRRSPRAGLRAAGTGLYAAALRRRRRWLPVVEETALETAEGLGAFVEAVLARARLDALLAAPAPEALAAFAARHRWWLALRSPARAREVEALAARPPGPGALRQLEAAFMRAALVRRPTPAREVRLLRRLLALAKPALGTAARRELRALVAAAARDPAARAEARARLADHFAAAPHPRVAPDDLYLWPDAAMAGAARVLAAWREAVARAP